LFTHDFKKEEMCYLLLCKKNFKSLIFSGEGNDNNFMVLTLITLLIMTFAFVHLKDIFKIKLDGSTHVIYIPKINSGWRLY
jgi:hypothetical protein